MLLTAASGRAAGAVAKGWVWSGSKARRYGGVADMQDERRVTRCESGSELPLSQGHSSTAVTVASRRAAAVPAADFTFASLFCMCMFAACSFRLGVFLFDKHKAGQPGMAKQQSASWMMAKLQAEQQGGLALMC